MYVYQILYLIFTYTYTIINCHEFETSRCHVAKLLQPLSSLQQLQPKGVICVANATVGEVSELQGFPRLTILIQSFMKQHHIMYHHNV